MANPAIVFERSEAVSGNKTKQVIWKVVKPEGTGIAIRVSREGINIEGGVPAFDDQKEERDWNWRIEMAIIAMKLIRQESLVPTDAALNQIVRSSKDPE